MASEAAVASPPPGNLLDLRGDLPKPRQIDVSALHKLLRVNESTSDPHQAGKLIVYSGTPLLEALKAGGLVFDSGMAGLRDAVKMTVIVEAADGYPATFSMAELDPELTDRVTSWQISRTANRSHQARDLSALLFPARNGALGVPGQILTVRKN